MVFSGTRTLYLFPLEKATVKILFDYARKLDIILSALPTAQQERRERLMAVIHFSAEGFDKALEQGAPMLVDFWADWCGPCRMLAPVIDKLAEKYDGWVAVGKVNVDEQAELAARYGVQSIPTVIFFKGGQEAARTVGVQPQPAYEALIEENL